MAITEHDLGPVRGDINDSVATFTAASTRANIASGDTGKTIFGKISKWFADLKTAAFCTVVNNFTTTTANTVADGRALKTLKDQYDELNRNIESVNTARNNEYYCPDTLNATLNIDYNNIYAPINRNTYIVSAGAADLPAGINYAIRKVYATGGKTFVVQLIEISPVAGKQYFKRYNGTTWGAWSTITPV